ncbi:MAG: sigma-54 dependent transcriptional regulator [Desulfomonilaceae bacterium]|nr:sigma-54 dependent transcriptional regulator [Desulfomonilaceae bacterium]
MGESFLSKLLIVDDEQDMLNLLARTVSSELPCTVATATSAYQAQTFLESDSYDLILLDIRMPGMDGMEFLGKLRKERPDTTVLMMTAYGTIDMAVEAIKKGAYDFLTKPFDLDNVVHLISKALERSTLIKENRQLQRRLREHEGLEEIVGTGPRIMKVLETIRLVANTDATVLITGESGTGKDLVARALHRTSHRSDHAFVPVNCPNLPEEILESELFGYRKGAFTHAVRDKKGLFLEAEGGTIYLDEIGDISGTLQTKLLRVIQEKEIRPLGETKSIKVDARIVASTNRNLKEKIEQGLFREDLFYRLNVISLQMPPLRERPEDIPSLARHFLQRCAEESGKEGMRISPELAESLVKYSWPGNVRELENLIRRAVILCAGPEIRNEDVELERDLPEKCLVTEEVKRLPYKEAKRLVLERFHREYVSEGLARSRGNVTQAARACGLERQALQQVMRKYGIKSKDFQP